MHTQNILCPTDFSEPSDAAIRYASSLAHHYKAKLHLVFVMERPVAYGAGDGVFVFTDEDREAIKQKLLSVKPSEDDVEFEHHVLDGEPAHEIVALAKKVEADLIVMGTHGRTGLFRLLMGSVAEQVVRKAECPVLALRQPASVLEEQA